MSEVLYGNGRRPAPPRWLGVVVVVLMAAVVVVVSAGAKPREKVAPSPSRSAFPADGDLVAIQLLRASLDTRFATGHPGRPSDVAVLHLELAFDNSSGVLCAAAGGHQVRA